MLYCLGWCYLLYMWFNLVCNRTGVVLDAALNPHQLLLLMSHQRDWKFKGRMVRRPSVSDDFWSTSTCDLDNNSMVQSQRSISSISTTNQTINFGSGIGSTSSNSDYVNNGKFSSNVILCFLLMYWEIMAVLKWCDLDIFMTPFLWVMFMILWLVRH